MFVTFYYNCNVTDRANAKYFVSISTNKFTYAREYRKEVEEIILTLRQFDNMLDAIDDLKLGQKIEYTNMKVALEQDESLSVYIHTPKTTSRHPNVVEKMVFHPKRLAHFSTHRLGYKYILNMIRANSIGDSITDEMMTDQYLSVLETFFTLMIENESAWEPYNKTLTDQWNLTPNVHASVLFWLLGFRFMVMFKIDKFKPLETIRQAINPSPGRSVTWRFSLHANKEMWPFFHLYYNCFYLNFAEYSSFTSAQGLIQEYVRSQQWLDEMHEKWMKKYKHLAAA